MMQYGHCELAGKGGVRERSPAQLLRYSTLLKRDKPALFEMVAAAPSSLELVVEKLKCETNNMRCLQCNRNKTAAGNIIS